MELYSGDLLAWAKHKTSSLETAQDLVQDTFMAALQAYDKFEERSKPKTWLIAILNNKIKEHYAKKKRHSTNTAGFEENAAIELTDNMFHKQSTWSETELFFQWNDKNLLDDIEFLETLELCINHLPEKWKSAIILKYRLGEDAEKICQELEISSSNYWQIMHRAKLMLKKCLDSNWLAHDK